MNDTDKESIKIIKAIDLNIANMKWQCMEPGCENNAINSHLLQRNGILNHIAESGHLVEIKSEDFFKVKNHQPLQLKKVGIKHAISQPLFCSVHDSSLFQDIETPSIDFFEPKNQMLFSYRSLCAELRKKQKSRERLARTLKSNILAPKLSSAALKRMSSLKFGFEIGIADMEKVKAAFESGFKNEDFSFFSCRTYETAFNPVCASGLFSPIHPNSDAIEKAATQKEPLNHVIINIIPQTSKLVVILCYQPRYSDDWIKEYVASWSELIKLKLQEKLTDILANRIETWCISTSAYNSIPTKTKNEFISYWNENTNNLLTSQTTSFNLFACC